MFIIQTKEKELPTIISNIFAPRPPNKGAKGPFTFSININVSVYNSVTILNVPIVMQNQMHRMGDFSRLLFHYDKHNISVDVDVDSNVNVTFEKDLRFRLE